MELLVSLGAFGLITLLAAMSPGPDFLVVAKNSIQYSRRIGFYTALGVGTAILVHVLYSILGVGLVISQSIVLFSIIKIGGALYLMYLGFQLMRTKGVTPEIEKTTNEALAKDPMAAFREGFLTNVLNPKATLFFLSVFSQVVNPSYSYVVQALFGLEAAIIVFVWFAVLALFLTHSLLRTHIEKAQKYILRIMGAGLVLLGIKVLVSKANA